MASVGYSSNSLRGYGLSNVERLRIFREHGASAVELSFPVPNELFDFEITPELLSEIKKYDYVSVHAPRREVEYKGDETTKRIIEKLGLLCEKIPVQGIVIHPDTVVDFQPLIESGLPFLIENMDHRKKSGNTTEHIRSLMKNTPFRFVFDAQHAYEFDPSMKFALDLLEVIGDRLQHMHVSGCKGKINDQDYNGHVPTYLADNKEAIERFLSAHVDVPKISEGMLNPEVLIDDYDETISSEIRFLNSFEKNLRS